MRLRSWPFLLLGFGSLLALLGLSSVALHKHIEQVRVETQAAQKESEDTGRVLQEVRTGIYEFAVVLRDYLLERNPEASAQQRRSLEALRDSAKDGLRALQQGSLQQSPELQRLRTALEDYWRAAEPVFLWTPAQKTERGPQYLRIQMVPQRQAAFRLAAEIESVSLSQSRVRQQGILRAQEDLRSYLRRVAAAALILGAIVAVISITRTRSLEANAARHLREIERGAEDFRRLSQKLTRSQEDERRNISRELHDQVGQLLTALRMEFGNIEESRQDTDGRFALHMAEARTLTEETLRAVRDMSTGLRPSVLDQLGLDPALKWQAREFTRRCGVPVELRIDGSLDGLTESHRTCVYRVVQEALTNCARHARASQIRIAVDRGVSTIALTVEDDGAGFDVPAARSRGLGLLGAGERVKELGGRLEITSQLSKGTRLCCEIPVPVETRLPAAHT